MGSKESLLSTGFKQCKDSNIWYSQLDNFYFTANQSSGESVNLSFNVIIENDKTSLITFLEEYKINNQIDYTVSNDSLVIKYKDTTNSIEFNDFINGVVEQLGKINAQNQCIHCENTTELSFYDTKDGVCLLCDSCAKKLTDKIDSVVNAPNNYGVGFFAALLGALIGSILWIIVGYFGYIASICGYAIAFASFYGYKFVRGKITNTGIVINIICVFIALLVANYINFAIAIFKVEQDAPFALCFIGVPFYLADSTNLGIFLKDFGLGLVFAFLGIWGLIKEKAKIAKESADLFIQKLD